MTDYQELMEILSIPRPNGSRALRQTRRALEEWLKLKKIPYQLQPFRIYPFFFECIGIWLILSRTLLALAVWARWDGLTLPVAILGLLGGTLDTALDWHLVTWPGAQTGENILIECNPAITRREVIFCAHYDTKTELLDHHQRMFLLKSMKFGIILTALLGIWGPINRAASATRWGMPSYWAGIILSLLMLLLAWALGLHLSLGRLLKPSQGAVDNGSSCAILFGLAEKLSMGLINLEETKITLALFSGEEVKMQGSRAYVQNRDFPFPTKVVNLEVMAQNGDYVYWNKDGNVFRLCQTDDSLNQAFSEAVARIAGAPAREEPLVNSDGASFLFAGIPATTIGTMDRRWGETGFHRPTDNIGRVVMDRLSQGVEILIETLRIQITNQN